MIKKIKKVTELCSVRSLITGEALKAVIQSRKLKKSKTNQHVVGFCEKSLV